ncbi:3-hydroxyacyl-CoA dehydrogenase [Iodidimonas muriae]|uniref:3-hydroxyacyl-CoA dehydrogenase n=1 Tax=Iodidimonas muriae TaxID=261467 RepID=A0ABQ2LEW6_9PROT|nr:3-hydroxyacyl-CoA dehydrogenase NAD-binding domain-containing protein [Iodidimonas muriae]GER07674.1 3-hydroxyacyl-CoA dehydrogenase [Kordiimonadales bacterium JCM 17843]GGO14639.1 3-hydroxyacyl-CoA dehydrogenase [Iodidimonas muriae]
MSTVSLHKQGRIGVIAVDHPPVNAISQAVREGIITQINAANADDHIAAIVLIAKGRTFMAGADITEFGLPPKSPGFPQVIDALEQSPKPVIAAIHGTALGGGLELALACHFRIAHEGAKLGLPEVTLGIIPGAQGTQRLPRLVGLPLALDMIVSGKPITAQKAHQAGLVDGLVKGEADALPRAAIAYADKIISDGTAPRRLSQMEVAQNGSEADLLAKARADATKKMRGMLAPQKAIDALEAALTLPFEDGAAKERSILIACMASPQSKALQHAFFAERKAARLPKHAQNATPRPFNQIGIIGGGTMGCGIALACLGAGLYVTMIERDAEALKRARNSIHKSLDENLARGRIDKAAHTTQEALFSITTDMTALSKADIIIEAVFEKMEVKKSIFRDLDKVAKKGAILATNTSYLNVDDIASVTGRPADILGLHFFSPANIMKLLEVVEAKKTAPDVLATAMLLAKKIRKIAVIARVCHGFIGNRMLEGYLREAGLLMLEGAAPQQIDKAIRDFGYPMGPLQMIDMAGMDIGYMLRKQFPASRFDPNAYRVMNRLVEMDRKGQKTGAGIYRYEAGNRTPLPDSAVDKITEEEAQKAGITRRTISDEEIIDRCILSLVNEGARILEDRIAMRASDIDVTYLYGYGFPRWRGGPMFYASQRGLDKICDRIKQFGETVGTRWWTPAPLLQKLAQEGKTFTDFDAE